MNNKFKVGDRVQRTSNDWNRVKRGEVYTVTGLQGLYSDGMRLEEVEGEYSPEGFELAQESPEQCPVELVKVWEELQKPYEERGVIEYFSGAEWISAGKYVSTLSSNLQYRIKPEPSMTWEEFKAELFKLSNINNVIVEGSLNSIRVFVEYAGVNQRIFSFRCNATEVFKQSTIDSIKAYTGVSK